MTTLTTLHRELRTRERQSPLALVGGDFGNATALLSDGAQIVQIPAYVGTGSLADLLASRGGAGGTPSLAPGEYAITYVNQTYFVGELALSQARDATAARGDTARYTNGHTLRLLMALVGACFGSDVRLRLVTGVPPAVMKAQPQIGAQIAAALSGTHYYTFHDAHGAREIALTIEAVVVVMECVATLAALGTPGEPIGIVDIGGHTVDVSWFDAQGRVVDARTDSLAGAGVERIGEILSAQFRQQHGRALRADEMAQILAAYLQGEGGSAYQRGLQRIPYDQIGRAVGAVAHDINTFLAQRWGLSDGSIGADGASVLVVGGGARFLSRLLRIDTEVRAPEMPEQENVKSYQLFASRIEERQRWPQIGG